VVRGREVQAARGGREQRLVVGGLPLGSLWVANGPHAVQPRARGGAGLCSTRMRRTWLFFVYLLRYGVCGPRWLPPRVYPRCSGSPPAVLFV
jgi:hypothetical protein